MSKRTLDDRIEQGISQHRFTLDGYETYPDMHLHCWCGGSLLVDYQQIGVGEMKRRLTSFVAAHEKCPKPRQIDLSPDLEAGIKRAKERNYAAKGKP